MKKLINLFGICFLPIVNGIGVAMTMLLYFYASMEIGHVQLSLLSFAAVTTVFVNLIFADSEEPLVSFARIVAFSAGMSGSFLIILPPEKRLVPIGLLLIFFIFAAVAHYWVTQRFGTYEGEAVTP